MRKILDLGCGQNKTENAIGVDISPHSKADVIWDLNRFPYPFKDNEFDLVYCNSILEHLDDITQTMAEVHRITKPNGEVIILTPHFSSKDALADHTHKHTLSYTSLDHLIVDTKSYHPANAASFKKIQTTLGLPTSDGSPKDLIKKAANKFPHLYERYLVHIFPVKGLYFRLKVVK